VFTARLAFALPVASLVTLTVAIYSGLYAAIVKLLPSIYYTPLWPAFSPRVHKTTSVYDPVLGLVEHIPKATS
jgi:hypothetical protein